MFPPVSPQIFMPDWCIELLWSADDLKWKLLPDREHLLYEMWNLTLLALGSRISTSRISQGGGCHKKANLMGHEKPSQSLGNEAHATEVGKPVCETRDKGALLFMDWGSPLWSKHTHAHAGTDTNRVGGISRWWQRAFSVYTKSDTWLFRHPSSFGTRGDHRAPLFSPVWYSDIQAKVWSLAGKGT